MEKHLSEDENILTINAKAQKAQQNIRTFSKEIDRLGERNKSLQRQMESLEVAEKKILQYGNSDVFHSDKKNFFRHF